MQVTTHETSSRGWPPSGLVQLGEPLLDAAGCRVVEGFFERNGVRAIASLRDLGARAHADLWRPRLQQLLMLSCPALAPIVSARIVDERFFILTTRRPTRGVTVHERLELGPLSAPEATAVARAALVGAEALHTAGLSAAGMRLGSAVLEGEGGPPIAVITTYGLYVDQKIDFVAELREIALRTLALVGATQDETGIRVPPHALPPVVTELLREAGGLVTGHRIESARQLLAALRVAAHAGN